MSTSGYPRHPEEVLIQLTEREVSRSLDMRQRMNPKLTDGVILIALARLQGKLIAQYPEEHQKRVRASLANLVEEQAKTGRYSDAKSIDLTA